MTHYSLAANQRPNISLIDRRHFDDVALPIRITNRCTTGVYVNAEAIARPLTALSHINVRVNRRAAPYRASVLNALLGVASRGAPRRHQEADGSCADTACCAYALHP